jgi:nucleoside-diphosphate-sugar epimerase
LSAPKGVAGRNSDNSMILDCLGWEPSIRLRDGLEQTYRWIEKEMEKQATAEPKQERLVYSMAL